MGTSQIRVKSSTLKITS